MRQTLCKRTLIFSIIFSFAGLFATAQDSTRTNNPLPVTKPAKTATTAPGKATTTAKATSSSLTSTKTIRDSVVTVKAPAKITDSSLKGQYEDLLKYSWIQKNYRVITPNRLTSLWKSVTDSLNAKEKMLEELKKQNEEQTKQLNQLSKPTPDDTKPSPSLSNTIEVLGIHVDESTYNMVVLGTILLLVLGLAGVIFATKKNSVDAKQNKQLYDEVSAEYQTYKAKSKEKEQKLARELQTERNTIEDLHEQLQAIRSGEDPVKKGKR